MSIWYFARAILGGTAVVLTFAALKKALEKGSSSSNLTQDDDGDIFPKDFKASELISKALWAKGDVLELADDVVPWINNGMENFKRNGATEVFIVKGVALSDFVKQRQEEGYDKEITSDDLNVIQNSTIQIVINDKGKLIVAQMIRAQFGISNDSDKQFQGQKMIKVKL